MSKALTWEQIANELVDFLDEEAFAPDDCEDCYYYNSGAINFAARLRAAAQLEVTPG